MGLTIHYSGNLKNKMALPQLVEEVKDIAGIFGWPFEIYETEFGKNCFGRKKVRTNLYGIQFTPPQCETVSFCFYSNGRLTSYWSWREYMRSCGEDKSLLEGGSFVKTQFAGWQVHKTLILLFRHLEKKYFRKFKVHDEANYWETGDEKILKGNFDRMGFLLNGLEKTFSENSRTQNESISKYMERVLKEFYERIHYGPTKTS